MRLQAKLVDIRHEFKLELGELAHHIHGGLAGHQCDAFFSSSSSNSHGTRYTVEPCQSRVGAEHAERHPTLVDGRVRERALETADVVTPEAEAGGGQRQAGTQGLAMPLKVDSQSPPQCTGCCWPPTVAERAYRQALPLP